MRDKITDSEYEKLVSYFNGFYEYDEDRNEIPINPLLFRDVDGDTSLHIACRRGDLWAVQLLAKGGVDINAIGDMEMTPLHAVHRAKNISPANREAIERYLIENGANTDVRDGFGLKPLQNNKDSEQEHPSRSKWECDKRK